MGKWGTRLVIVTASTVLSVIPVAIAHRQGADPGYSGGPFDAGDVGGGNCTFCHPFNPGTGRVDILDAPRRYVANVEYPIRVRPIDPQMDGAGFEISAESVSGHEGLLIVTDAVNTRYTAPNLFDYVTHTGDGVDNSIAAWVANGGQYDFPMTWLSPNADAGVVTFFAAANAVDVEGAFGDVKFYGSAEISHFARPGDADGDSDLDLFDFSLMQRCYSGGPLVNPIDECLFADMNGDKTIIAGDVRAFVLAFEGPVAPDPAAYVLADAVRGGLLYDTWWRESRVPAPTGDHPLYPAIGNQAGSVTFRCKECHGWDYKGVDGAYGTGSHFTGIPGVFGTTKTAKQIYELLKAAPGEVPNGHDMDAYGMSDRDLWDVVRMVREGVVDTDDYITQSGTFSGDPDFGNFYYDSLCTYCHGFDGTGIDFGTPGTPEYIGTVANENPWEFLHKTRFGHPGSPMPSAVRLLWTDSQLRDTGAYSATLPQ